MAKSLSCFEPSDIPKKLDAISELGWYRDKNDFITDAINTLLSAHRELRIAIACKLYENEEISLGRAAEIIDTSIEEMKKIISDHEIKLVIGTAIPKTKDRARTVLRMLRGS